MPRYNPAEASATPIQGYEPAGKVTREDKILILQTGFPSAYICPGCFRAYLLAGDGDRFICAHCTEMFRANWDTRTDKDTSGFLQHQENIRRGIKKYTDGQVAMLCLAEKIRKGEVKFP